MQTFPMPFRQEYECGRVKDLRAGAQPRRSQRRIRLALFRR
jgi:hypothetical protein